MLHDGGTYRLSGWVNRALTDPGVRDLDLRDCAADVDGSLVEVPCDAADAEYRVILQQTWGQDSTPPSDPSETREGLEDWDRAVETPSCNVCLLRISGDCGEPPIQTWCAGPGPELGTGMGALIWPIHFVEGLFPEKISDGQARVFW
ncbi:hypothetical protein GCM10009733_057800 [Nonomuraea maheshkhaliensis]|uniref:Uncharacterized protein n=1 Tax=Nonomuraea maheshkhaliensis TaxID=419590 RepID=A0ABN2FMS9_9ACTN